MPTYKLYYFQGRGRAEHIRQIFKLAGKEFENVQLTQESWPSHKDDMPLNQVPVVEVDGVKIGQTLAISRFLGRQFGMAGKTDIENAKIDMLGDLIQDMSVADGIKQWPYVLLGMMPDKKEDFFREKVRPALEQFAPLVEKFLLENGNNLLVGDNVSWVDVFAAEYFSKFIDFGEKDCLEAFPRILELIARIHNIPAIKKHIEERPASLA